MNTHPSPARPIRAILASGLITATAFTLGACAGQNRAPFKADAAPAATLTAINGDWTPTREDARVRELSIERDGSTWEVEIERIDDAGNRIEREFPARIFAVNNRTILEVEIARGKASNNTASAAAFFYSSVTVDGDTLRSSALNADWLRAYTQRHPSLKIAAVAPWDTDRALGVGRAQGLSSMISAAAADESAWEEASIWTRSKKD
jgi:hypothetical protein